MAKSELGYFVLKQTSSSVLLLVSPKSREKSLEQSFLLAHGYLVLLYACIS